METTGIIGVIWGVWGIICRGVMRSWVGAYSREGLHEWLEFKSLRCILRRSFGTGAKKARLREVRYSTGAKAAVSK